MAELIIPIILTVVSVIGLARKRDVYSLMADGAKDGLRLLVQIVPSLIVLLTGIKMLRASGALDSLAAFLSPVFGFFGIPSETAPLVLLRPFSGSAALAVGAELMAQYGVNSPVGRTAAVMLGSTETTFYTISVYFGASKIRDTRYAVPAALLADFTGFCVASLSVKFLF